MSGSVECQYVVVFSTTLIYSMNSIVKTDPHSHSLLTNDMTQILKISTCPIISLLGLKYGIRKYYVNILNPP